MKYHWFKDFWQWWVGLLWFVGFEAYALIRQAQSRQDPNVEWVPTLSQLVWRAYKENAWIQWPVMFLSVGLLIHFFVRRQQEAPLSMLLFGGVMIVAYAIRRWFM